MNKVNVKYQTTLAKIKIRYREILLNGRLKSIEKRTKRLNDYTLHIIKNYSN